MKLGLGACYPRRTSESRKDFLFFSCIPWLELVVIFCPFFVRSFFWGGAFFFWPSASRIEFELGPRLTADPTKKTPVDRYAIVDLYTELHDLGVVHGDVETRHICRRRRVRLVGADPLPDPDPDPSKCKYDLAIIDFDQARIVIPNGPACRQEINEVKARLWQEDE